MSKKKTGLGKSLIRDHRKKANITKDGFRHTSDLPDGFDWGRLNLHSVTEQTSVDEFLDKVQLAHDEYSEEFSNIKILNQDDQKFMMSEEDRDNAVAAQDKLKHVLCIPRRPQWDSSTTKEELETKEREEFLNWRRKLAMLREEEHINLTPYEKNLEIWRQLWRVVEKSDIVVQIVDARNPLLYRCEDLETYVNEVDNSKINILLINKADFLSEKQRQLWAEYFDSVNLKAIFFSALQQLQTIAEVTENDNVAFESIKDEKMESSNTDPVENVHVEKSIVLTEKTTEGLLNDSEMLMEKNSEKILSREELIFFFKQISESHTKNGIRTVGFIGYPNVGKSSTINSLLMNKKVQVSATPGKTKHFQTHMIDSELCLCDCPGLVFPNFVLAKADMVISGILPIDQLTDHIAPVTLVTNLIPKSVLESTYSVIIPTSEDESHSSPPSAEAFLNAYGYMRGFMTHRGLPDTARSARYILKDFVNGKLLYCYSPPNVDQTEYSQYSIKKISKSNPKFTSHNVEKKDEKSSVLDQNFFNKTSCQIHMKGINTSAYNGSLETKSTVHSNETSKPWKKHNNRNKREKLRRVYAAADR